MADSNSSLPRGLRIGSLLVALSGLVPLIVATIVFVAFLTSEFNPEKPWLAAHFPPSPACFSLNDIRNGVIGKQTPVPCTRKNQPATCAQCLAANFVTAQHVELVNLMNTGLLVTLLAIFGLRRRQKWSWYAELFSILWVGLNDGFALLKAHEPPLPFVGEVIGLVGLVLVWPYIFRYSDSA